jgi:hypothetical protein
MGQEIKGGRESGKKSMESLERSNRVAIGENQKVRQYIRQVKQKANLKRKSF